MIKLVFLFSESLEIRLLRTYRNLTVLNMGYKIDLLQPKQDVFWSLTYSRSETNNAWIIPLEVIKFVYLHPTYFLSVLILGLHITCTKFWILCNCTRPTSYLYPIATQNMTLAKWWNTSIAYRHLVHSMVGSAWRKAQSGKVMDMTRCNLGNFWKSYYFRHQAPPHMQSRQRPYRRKIKLFVAMAVL